MCTTVDRIWESKCEKVGRGRKTPDLDGRRSPWGWVRTHARLAGVHRVRRGPPICPPPLLVRPSVRRFHSSPFPFPFSPFPPLPSLAPTTFPASGEINTRQIQTRRLFIIPLHYFYLCRGPLFITFLIFDDASLPRSLIDDSSGHALCRCGTID